MATATHYQTTPDVEAMHLHPDATPAQAIEIYQWVESHIGSTQPAGDQPGYSPTGTGITIDPADGMMVIRGRNGDMKVTPGDYVIRVRGEFFPYTPTPA